MNFASSISPFGGLLGIGSTMIDDTLAAGAVIGTVP